MTIASVGEEEGDICGRNECSGVMRRVDGDCSCHLSAPCGYCTECLVRCDECGEEFGTSMIERPAYSAATTHKWPPMKSLDDYYKEMDGSELKWISLPHTNFTMIKKGKCPIDMPHDQVAEKVVGTFGGRFSSWREVVNQHGKPIIAFTFIAHTD